MDSTASPADGPDLTLDGTPPLPPALPLPDLRAQPSSPAQAHTPAQPFAAPLHPSAPLHPPAERHPTAQADLQPHLAPALSGLRSFLGGPVSPATWRAVAQAAVGFPWLMLFGILALVLAPLSVGLIPVFGVGVPMLLLTLAGARWFARVERDRLRAQLGVAIVPGTARQPGSWSWRSLWSWRGLRSAMSDPVGWRSLAYASVAMLLVCVQISVVWGLGATLALLATPVTWDDGGPSVEQGLVLALALVSPWLWAVATQSLALTHARLATALLGRSRTETVVERAEAAASQARDDADAARRRAEHLSTTRTRAVGAADDDRRRIERDLHDGAQQRLVALGVELGTAKRAAATDPEAATAALDHAHREIKETLAELRDLVRGIHPAVLTDRGLDAALSAIAARHPVPVTVEVGDPATLVTASPGAQAAAYFVTAEALTNSARHSGATRVVVRADVVRSPDHPDLLRLEVLDDGHGGAVASPGGGLDGLRSRVEALDGTFRLDSPADRGTRITVEVPCAS